MLMAVKKLETQSQMKSNCLLINSLRAQLPAAAGLHPSEAVLLPGL